MVCLKTNLHNISCLFQFHRETILTTCVSALYTHFEPLFLSQLRQTISQETKILTEIDQSSDSQTMLHKPLVVYEISTSGPLIPIQINIFSSVEHLNTLMVREPEKFGNHWTRYTFVNNTIIRQVFLNLFLNFFTTFSLQKFAASAGIFKASRLRTTAQEYTAHGQTVKPLISFCINFSTWILKILSPP